MAKRKKAARIDLATETMLLAEEDLAAMRPALAVAPDLVVQALLRKRRRRPTKQAKKKMQARKSSAKKARKSSAKKGRKSPAKGKRAKKAGRT
jgi:hypothetical protein